MGVQLSVDDVGTNWSSFEPFKRHAISTVKIDGSFIAGLESEPGHQPAGGGDGHPHGPLPRHVGHRASRWRTASRLSIVQLVQRRRRPGFLLRPAHVRARRRSFAGGPEIPVFSRTEPQTLLRSRRRPGSARRPPDRRGARAGRRGSPARWPPTPTPRARSGVDGLDAGPDDGAETRRLRRHPTDRRGGGRERSPTDAVGHLPVDRCSAASRGRSGRCPPNCLYTPGRETRCRQGVAPGEDRVAIVPEVAAKLAKTGVGRGRSPARAPRQVPR